MARRKTIIDMMIDDHRSKIDGISAICPFCCKDTFEASTECVSKCYSCGWRGEEVAFLMATKFMNLKDAWLEIYGDEPIPNWSARSQAEIEIAINEMSRQLEFFKSMKEGILKNE